jgi:peroxiredoxin
MDSAEQTPRAADEAAATNLPLARGTLLPALSLASVPDGEPVDLRGGRGPRVLFLLHPEACDGCRANLREIMQATAQVAEWGGRLLVVTSGSVGKVGGLLPEPSAHARVLSDPERAVARHLGLSGAAVLIADEWGEIFFAADAGADHEMPAQEEIARWVQFIAIQCPECEQPEGEWRTLD